jgi:ABC-type phosphate transport system substrate-binding protein
MHSQLVYTATGSGTGQCLIMGYSSNNAACKARSADPDSISPKVDFAGSDSVLSTAQFAYMTDLQMYPATAGGVVPIYNLREHRVSVQCLDIDVTRSIIFS